MSPDSTSWLTSYNDDATAYINVCKPVGSDTGCDPTAAVCVKSNNHNHTVSALCFFVKASIVSLPTIGHVNEYPTMHYFGNPRRIQ